MLLLVMDEVSRMAVAQYVRHSRKAADLPQEKLADKLRLTRTSISNIEKGRQALTLDLFCRICFVFNDEPGAVLNSILKKSKDSNISKNEVKDPKIRNIIEKTIGI